MCLTLNPSSEPEHSLGMGKHGGGGGVAVTSACVL